IRNAGDFRRLVPLRTPAELWREYWQAAYPNVGGATWPGPIPYLAVSSSQQNGPFPYIPISPALWAAQQTAVLTALAFIMHARPRARLCAGRLLFLGSGLSLVPPGSSAQAESLEAVAIRELPSALHPYACAASDDRLLGDLAKQSIGMPVTCLAGTAERLGRFFEQAKRHTGRERISDIWPQLTGVLYTRGPRSPERSQLVSEVGNAAVLCLEMYFRPEGAVALEDPRHEGLRLLPDHGVYFEFVPVDEVGKLSPARYAAAEVKLGVPYALAISSPAGVWACLVGSVVQFERRDPPLLRLVEMNKLWEQPVLVVPPPARLVTAKQTFSAQPHQARNVESEGAVPGRSLRAASPARRS
ncbi:MAG TPA: GH3 auxin-responsive promoter family protein, partial [Gemmataceae bacterium]|nr:GH3 auxin-responsive promoter family protein [Gemmataceae bacterium]